MRANDLSSTCPHAAGTVHDQMLRSTRPPIISQKGKKDDKRENKKESMQTYLGLFLGVATLAPQENSDVVLVLLRKPVVGEADHPPGPDPQARLLERFALHASGKVLALLQVATRKSPVFWISISYYKG